MTLAPGSKLGPYEILSLLGAGGMGEVYRAKDTRLGRDVAIKVLPGDFLEDEERKSRFEREARLLATLNHPGIAAVYSFEEISGRHLRATELLDGETLRERLRAGPLPARKAIDVAAQIAQALAAAHEKPIVHRDLKPENVFLTKDGRVKILDFGLAKLSRRGQAIEKLTEAGTLSLLTEAGAVFGTVGYMSPEQARGEPADHRSDIFSFGTILYEMLSGKNPFGRDTSPETMTAILKAEPGALSEAAVGVSPALSAIVGRCLEKKPEARFQSSADLAFALLSLSSSPAAPIPGRRGRGVAFLALAAGLVLGFLLARNLWSRGGSPALPEFTRLTFRRGTVMNARFSSDGKTVQYSASWEGQPQRAFSTRPGEPEVPIGPPDALFLGASRDGQLAFAMRPAWAGWRYQGTLAISHGGSEAPREVAPGVEEAGWAPDDVSMAVVRNEAKGASGKWILEYPTGTRLFESQGRITNARISPDGHEVAFESHPSIDAAGEVALAVRGGGTKTLSAGWKNVNGLAWSPSGEEILFTASKEGRSQSLWAVSRSGRLRAVARWGGSWNLEDVAVDGALLLTRGQVQMSMMAPEQQRDLTWFDWSVPWDLTPDGRSVLFMEWGDGVGARPVAFLRSTDGSPAVRLGEGYPAAVAPDGRRALVFRAGPPRFVLVPTGPGEEMTLPAGDVRRFGAGAFYYSTAFFPGGRRFVFVGAAAEGPQRLWVQDVDGGPPRQFGPAENLSQTAVSPDGSLVAACENDTRRLVVLSASGEVRRRVDLEGDSLPIGWYSDNRSVFLRVRERNATRIDRLDTASGKRELWRDLKIQDQAGILRGVFVSYISHDGKTIITSYLRVLNDLYLVRNVK